jgi:hypothetical protein
MSVVDGFGGGSRGVGGREIAAWTLAAFVQFLAWTLSMHPRMSNDSYQYLSVAENVAAGRGLETNLVHFDVERAHGTIPTPLTTFPAGFPIATAAVSRLGPAPETAALAVSLASMSLVVALLAVACNLLGLVVWVARGTILLFAVNAYALYYAGTVSTEPLFTLLFVASVTAALGAEGAESERSMALLSLAAGLAAGLSYWVRYAGLLAIAGLGFALGTLLVVRRTRRALQTLVLTMGAALVPVALGFARNLRLTGTWQGGNTKAVTHPLVEMLKKSVTALGHLFVGEALTPPARVCEGLFVLVLGFVLLRWRQMPRGAAAARAFIVTAVAVVYSALMFYVGLHSVISYAARMFLPALPLLLVAFASMIRPPPRTALASRVFALAGFAAYAMCGPLNFGLPAPPSGHLEIASRLVLPAADGKPLTAWIEAHIGPHEPILAADGQATGYLLRRPTVSLVGVEYSDFVWTEHELEETLDRFGIRWLILYAEPQASGGEKDSPFLMSLVAGRPDSDLRLAARNEQALVFEHVRPGG